MNEHELIIYGGTGVIAAGAIWYLTHRNSGATTPVTASENGGAEDPLPTDASPSPSKPTIVGNSFLAPTHHATKHPTKQHPAEQSSYPPFMVDILAGRFDANLAAVRAAFHREEKLKPSVIFTTEQYNKDRTAILRDNPHYHVTRPAGNQFQRENTTLLNKQDWDVNDSGTWELNAGGGINRLRFPGYAVWTLATSRHNGHMVLFVDLHMPAHLDPSSRFYNPKNILLWTESMRSLRAHIGTMRAQHPGLKVIIGGDWNIRQNSARFIAAIRKYLPGFQIGRGGEFGNTVSLGFVRGKAGTVNPQGSSDHPIKRLHFTWPRTKPKGTS